MNRKEYKMPNLEILVVNVDNIIATSGFNVTYDGETEYDYNKIFK